MMFRLQSNGPGRDDMLNEHSTVFHHNPIHHQLYHLLLHLESWSLERSPNAGTKRVDPFQQPQFCRPIGPLLRDLPHALAEHLAMVCNALTPLRQIC
jgi:hypothetical protein